MHIMGFDCTAASHWAWEVIGTHWPKHDMERTQSISFRIIVFHSTSWKRAKIRISKKIGTGTPGNGYNHPSMHVPIPFHTNARLV